MNFGDLSPISEKNENRLDTYDKNYISEKNPTFDLFLYANSS